LFCRWNSIFWLELFLWSGGNEMGTFKEDQWEKRCK
jgi:hypothetical protein